MKNFDCQLTLTMVCLLGGWSPTTWVSNTNTSTSKELLYVASLYISIAVELQN